VRGEGCRSPAHRQRGVALITAMLVLALATILAVSMTRDQELAIRRGENLRNAEQAWQYALGLEAVARKRLHEDQVSGGATDNTNENWAARLPPLPVPGGVLTGKIADLDGRFNLNTLAPGAPGRDLALARFQRLLAVLGLDPGLTNAVEDWLDPDLEARSGGAEDYFYSGLQPPYRTGNRLFADASELRLVMGVDSDAWSRLERFVTALPDVATAINVNTAPPPVLQSLADGLSRRDAEALARRGRAGFGTVEDFLSSEPMRPFAVPRQGLAVSSHYFRAHGVVELDGDVFHFYSLIRRDRDGLAVLRRSRGVP